MARPPHASAESGSAWATMHKDEARSVLEQALSVVTEGECEVSLGGGASHLTRFANNEVTQNVSERRYVLSMRVVLGKRTGRASGNDLSRAGVEGLARAATAAARLQPEIPDLLPLPGPQSYRTVDADDEATGRLGPEERARGVARAVGRCRKSGVTAAGIYETGRGTIGEYGELDTLAIANSRGLFAYHVGTDA